MIALALLALAVAEAAAPPRVVAAGATVEITELSRRDAFWRFRDELVGQVCVVGEPGLVRNKRRFYGGEMTCADGTPYYFYQVGVEVTDATPPAVPPAARDAEIGGGVVGGMEGVVGGRLEAARVAPPPPAPPPPVAAPAAPAARPGRKADGRLTGAPVAAGEMVRVVDVSPADALHGEKAAIVGRTCTVLEGPLVPSGDGWYAGRLFCGDAGQRQLYQVAVAPE